MLFEARASLPDICNLENLVLAPSIKIAHDSANNRGMLHHDIEAIG